LYRSDTSGDTYAFTGYLARASARWRTAVGSGTGVTWPAGTGARGNAGVAELLLQTPGAIAYVAIGQARRSRLQIAVLRNAAGTYSAPSPATIARAAAGAPTGYPLSTFSYVIVRRDSPKLAELKRFLRYAVGPGQSFATSVSFAPLPANVRRADLRIIARL
jgi:phosphate transport system substrate-binding protein